MIEFQSLFVVHYHTTLVPARFDYTSHSLLGNLGMMYFLFCGKAPLRKSGVILTYIAILTLIVDSWLMLCLTNQAFVLSTIISPPSGEHHLNLLGNTLGG